MHGQQNIKKIKITINLSQQKGNESHQNNSWLIIGF